MKRILLATLTTIIISCSSEKSQSEIIQEKAAEAIKKNMNDPDSYEFVSIDKIDTIVWTEKEQKDLLANAIISINDKSFTDSIKEVIKERKMNNDFQFYDVKMSIRGNNSYGAKMLADYYVKFDKDYNVDEAKQKDKK